VASRITVGPQPGVRNSATDCAYAADLTRRYGGTWTVTPRGAVQYEGMRLGHTWGSFWGMVRFDLTGRAPRSPVMMRDKSPARARTGRAAVPAEPAARARQDRPRRRPAREELPARPARAAGPADEFAARRALRDKRDREARRMPVRQARTGRGA
jgi:hypothetical protein